MNLIALRPVLYNAHQYDMGESLPVNDSEMVELWIAAGTAVWKDEAEPEKPIAKAIPATATPGITGMSSTGTDELIGHIPQTPERKTAKAGARKIPAKRKTQ